MSDHAFPSAATPPRRAGRFFLLLALLGLLAVTGFFAHRSWRKLEATTGTLEAEDALIRRMGYQLRELQGQNEALAQRIADAEAAGRRQATQLGSLGSVQESQGQALARMDETLSGSRARFQLAAVEELLQLAADRVALYHDRDTAAQALLMADERLAALGDGRLLKLREAITADRQALQAVPVADVSGAALSLGGLINREKDLPLAVRTATSPPTATAPVEGAGLPANSSWRARAWSGLKQALASVVRIRHEARPVDALLPPEQEVLIHHMLLMRLEAARLAVLRGETAATRDALASASAWLARYFQSDDASVRAAIAELDRLEQLPAGTALPVPVHGLQALQKMLKAAPAKP